MSKTTIQIDKKIQQLKERRKMALSREVAAQRKREEREAKETGLWLIKNDPSLMLTVKQRMLESRGGVS